MTDLRGLSLKQLRAFAAVMRAGSVAGAAQQLFVTPPAVATHLKTLEKLAGAPIQVRGPDGLRPTEIGEALLTMVAEMETTIARGERRITAIASGAEGTVTLGGVSTAKYFTPGIVAAFRKAHPGIRVQLAIGNRGAIVAGLERGEFDLVIMGRPPGHVATEATLLGDHPHVLIAPPDHPLAKDRHILPEDLLAQTFLAREEGSGTRTLTTRFLDRIGMGRPVRLEEMGTNETIKQAVIAGLGIALISEHTCMAEFEDKRLVALPFPGLPMMRHWYMLHREDRPLDRAATVLRDFVTAHRADLLPHAI
ncbi:LysR family transcriptional regulator [Rhodovulum sp. DZ06]|uniref:LysR family transcriptional regulator n=1 Tax=Rhodovulum sp. DZ06 TaxID=3425126 RepID=UPI003D33DE8D